VSTHDNNDQQSVLLNLCPHLQQNKGEKPKEKEFERARKGLKT
jgi:hypothetical protein